MDLSCYIPQIRCKADLMKFCIEATAEKSQYGYIVDINKDKALEMYKFFNKHIKLPDVTPATDKELCEILRSILSSVVVPPAVCSR